MISQQTKSPDREGLHELVRDSAGWMVMVLIDRQGDSPFLVSITPALRDMQIVSYQGHYDVWLRSKDCLEMIHSELTKERVIELLHEKMPSEEQFMKHGARWAEETFKYYGIQERK